MKIHVQLSAAPRRMDDGTVQLTAQVCATGDNAPNFTLPSTAIHPGDDDAAALVAEIKANTIARAALLGITVTETDVLVWGGPQ